MSRQRRDHVGHGLRLARPALEHVGAHLALERKRRRRRRAFRTAAPHDSPSPRRPARNRSRPPHRQRGRGEHGGARPPEVTSRRACSPADIGTPCSSTPRVPRTCSASTPSHGASASVRPRDRAPSADEARRELLELGARSRRARVASPRPAARRRVQRRARIRRNAAAALRARRGRRRAARRRCDSGGGSRTGRSAPRARELIEEARDVGARVARRARASRSRCSASPLGRTAADTAPRRRASKPARRARCARGAASRARRAGAAIPRSDAATRYARAATSSTPSSRCASSTISVSNSGSRPSLSPASASSA